MKNISLFSTAIILAGLMCSTSVFAAAPTEAAPVPTVPANRVKSIYSNSYTFAPTSLTSYNEAWWDNPSMDELNIGGNTALHYSGKMTGMIGWWFAVTNMFQMEKLHVDIWVPASGTMDFAPISANPTTPANKTLTLVGGQWNSFDFDLATDFPVLALAKVFQHQFMNYSAFTDIYVDNYYYYRTTDPVPDTEAPTNFTASLKSVSTFSIDLNVKADDNSGGITYKAYKNEIEVAEFSEATGEAATMTITGLFPNTQYSFVIKAQDESGNVNASPVTITATTSVGPAAAPKPARAAKDVMALYSDAYTAVTWFNVGSWGQSTVATKGNLAEGDEAMLCTNSNYLGWELQAPIPSFADMDSVHMDIYVAAAGSIQFTPIWGSELLQTYALVAGWNAIDAPLSAFTGINKANIYQVKWAEMPSTCWIDNVYFYKKASTTAIEEQSTINNQQSKMIINGRLVIMHNGRAVSVLGQDL